MKKRNTLMSLLLIVSLLASMVCVAGTDYTYAASKKIHLKKKSVSVDVGRTYQQKLIDKNGKTIKATKVKWKSLKTSVAKINKKGRITAVKAGTAKMTAKYKGKTYKFTVKISDPSRKAAKKLYQYIKSEGYEFSSGFRYFRGSNIYIVSDPVVVYGDDGKKYQIKYYVTGYDGDANYFCFCMKRKQLNTKKSFEDYTCIPVRIGAKTENASYIQEYELDYGNFANYVENCDITYAKYRYDGAGLSNFTIGWDKSESGSWYISDKIEDTIKGVEELLKNTVGIDVKDLGFTSIK